MIAEIVFSIVIALLIALLLPVSGRRGPAGFAGFFFFFLIFLFAGWAASLWLVPVGPVFYGVYWLGPLVVTLLLALILMAVIPASKPRSGADEVVRSEPETDTKTNVRYAVGIGFTIFFWIAMIGLLVAVYAGYNVSGD